ncbi:MAG: serine acetyltransferase [Candidatus Marinimicrobia bacterium]|nr:serine acetyltransferase [Candidatus Neomarinimicrobiota bacterium]MBL7023100.1 serine acetyltransferase [Candidatus Neomarinimicrobiota bacterium]MBL7109120.1 serine acetyltransferase [Candidatus Neomarinimicrobiota bacterium]
MKYYQIQTNVADNLLSSYSTDTEPFISDQHISFPKREPCFTELEYMKELLFPNYWNCGFLSVPNNKSQLESKLNDFGLSLYLGLNPYIADKDKVALIVREVIDKLPEIRDKMKKDIQAAYSGDPSATSYTEIIRSYPATCAVMVQRITNQIYKKGASSYARELNEHIHKMTGIDIHAGAEIGEYFFIDHGTGVVIGESCIIGDHVRIYQGVTLGALHFEKDENENEILKKGYKRHPNIGNHVVIGAGSKILGPVNIGNNVNIGANSWIEEDIPDHTVVFISEHPKLIKKKRKN